MAVSIDLQKASAFYRYGEASFLDASGQFEQPEEISIGSGVSIHGYYWLTIAAKGVDTKPKIIIGDGCICEQGLIIAAINRVELERDVTIEPHVYISDANHEYRQIGKPITAQSFIETSGEIRIEEGVRIGAGSAIIGNIRIGRDSIVQPGCVIEHDVPEKCVVGGTPARILQIYEPVLEQWIDMCMPLSSY